MEYINRELSQLAFNVRVLEQAKDASLPLLDRLKFLCISSTNLDEFFEIRVSGLKHRLAASAGPAGPDNMSSAEVLRTITEQTSRLVAEQYRLLNDELIPALRDAGIRFVRRDDWTNAQRAWLEHDVMQCGYCQAGQIMSAAALLARNPTPTDEEINKWMDGIICRCGTYTRIHAAVKSAADKMK